MNWDNIAKWLYGAIGAAIGAAANTVTVMIVAPETFNIHEGLSKVFTVAGVSAIVAVSAYLKQSPLPPIISQKTVTTTVREKEPVMEPEK